MRAANGISRTRSLAALAGRQHRQQAADDQDRRAGEEARAGRQVLHDDAVDDAVLAHRGLQHPAHALAVGQRQHRGPHRRAAPGEAGVARPAAEEDAPAPASRSTAGRRRRSARSFMRRHCSARGAARRRRLSACSLRARTVLDALAELARAWPGRPAPSRAVDASDGVAVISPA